MVRNKIPIPAPGASEITGAGQYIAQALAYPMIQTRIQPGKYKYPNRRKMKSGRVRMGKRIFVKSDTFPDGVTLGIPTWFIATAGIGAAMYILGFFEKYLNSEKHEKSWWDKQWEKAQKEGGIPGIGLPLWIAKYLPGYEEEE